MFTILNKRFFLSVIIFCACFISTTIAHAAIYYVSIAPDGTNGYGVGKDSNPGTKIAPLATIGKAVATASTGDTIVLNDGNYDTRAGNYSSSNLTITKGITLNAETPLGASIFTSTGQNAWSVNIDPVAAETITLGAIVINSNHIDPWGGSTGRGISVTTKPYVINLVLNGTKILNPTGIGIYCGTNANINLTVNSASIYADNISSIFTGLSCQNINSGNVVIKNNFDPNHTLDLNLFGNSSGLIYGVDIGSTGGVVSADVSGVTGIIYNSSITGSALGVQVRNILGAIIENSNLIVSSPNNSLGGSLGFKIASRGMRSDDGIIRNNNANCDFLSGYCIYITGNDFPNFSNNGKIYGNTITGKDCGGDGGCVTTNHGIAIDSETGGEIYNNNISDFYVGVLMGNVAGGVVNNNVITKPYGRALYSKGSTGTGFYNNTVIASPNYSAGAGNGGGACLWATDYSPTGPASRNVLFKNNICYSTADGTVFARVYPACGYTSLSTASFSNNLYYSTGRLGTGGDSPWNYGVGNDKFYSTFSAWLASGNDLGAINADPSFVDVINNNFQLKSDSPAISAGASVGIISDYLGNPIYGLPDVGAHEYHAPWDPADINNDGEVGPEDFAILKDNFGTSPATPAMGDIDGDGEVGPEDFAILKDHFNRADINLDGIVDLQDFSILKENYNASSATPAMGDLNGDNLIDLSDFSILKANYGAHR